jgi:hypothetical protein
MIRNVLILSLLSVASPFLAPGRVPSQRAGGLAQHSGSASSGRRPLFVLQPDEKRGRAICLVTRNHDDRHHVLRASKLPQEETLKEVHQDEQASWGYSQTLLKYFADWVSARGAPDPKATTPSPSVSSAADKSASLEVPTTTGPGPDQTHGSYVEARVPEPATLPDIDRFPFRSSNQPAVSSSQGISFGFDAASLLESALKAMVASNETSASNRPAADIASRDEERNLTIQDLPHPLYGMDGVVMREQEFRKYDRAVERDEKFFTFMRNLAFWKPEYLLQEESQKNDEAGFSFSPPSVLEEVGEDLPAAMENATAAALHALDDTVTSDAAAPSAKDAVPALSSNSWFSGATQVRVHAQRFEV